MCCFLCDAVLFSSTESERRGVPPEGKLRLRGRGMVRGYVRGMVRGYVRGMVCVDVVWCVRRCVCVDV